jgi:hypothetical protein
MGLAEAVSILRRALLCKTSQDEGSVGGAAARGHELPFIERRRGASWTKAGAGEGNQTLVFSLEVKRLSRLFKGFSDQSRPNLLLEFKRQFCAVGRPLEDVRVPIRGRTRPAASPALSAPATAPWPHRHLARGRPRTRRAAG